MIKNHVPGQPYFIALNSYIMRFEIHKNIASIFQKKKKGGGGGGEVFILQKTFNFLGLQDNLS